MEAIQTLDVPNVVLKGGTSDVRVAEVLGSAAEDPVAEQVEPVPGDCPSTAPQVLGKMHLRTALLPPLDEAAVRRLLHVLFERGQDTARFRLREGVGSGG